MRKVILTLAVLATAGDVEAGPFRRRAVYRSSESYSTGATGAAYQFSESYRGPAPAAAGDGSDDALAEVNALRAARGLPPYLPDPALAAGAKAAAAARAARLQFGHFTGGAGDFAFLPPGASADAAGCAAYPASYGFMACEVYGSYRYAGAASVRGADGRMFHHLFLRR